MRAPGPGILNIGLFKNAAVTNIMRATPSIRAISRACAGSQLTDLQGGLRDNRALRDSQLRYGQEGQERSEEQTSELQSLMRISYAVFRLKKKTTTTQKTSHHTD